MQRFAREGRSAVLLRMKHTTSFDVERLDAALHQDPNYRRLAEKAAIEWRVLADVYPAAFRPHLLQMEEAINARVARGQEVAYTLGRDDGMPSQEIAVLLATLYVAIRALVRGGEREEADRLADSAVSAVDGLLRSLAPRAPNFEEPDEFIDDD